MSHGGHCRTLPEVTCEDLAAAGAQKHKTKHPAGAPFRHCGFVIPCDADEYCDETQARRRWHQSSHARLQCLCGLDQRLLHGHAGRCLLPRQIQRRRRQRCQRRCLLRWSRVVGLGPERPSSPGRCFWLRSRQGRCAARYVACRLNSSFLPGGAGSRTSGTSARARMRTIPQFFVSIQVFAGGASGLKVTIRN